MRNDLGERDDLFLDLRREDVHTTKDHHVISTSRDAIHATEGTPAFALTSDDARDVARTIANERRAFLGERGHDHFAPLPIRHGLERLRIDDLDDEMILAYMQTILRFTLASHTRAHDLGKTIDIVDLDTELVLDL